ncbi:MAG: uracil-DNA glycosylase [Candidatus Eremiobacteraeota bacterium]|nr:uracil-DNA glycosylase [Candidatus Eremiobacteraeota bacterium]
MSIDSINRRVVRCTRCPELRTYCAQVAVDKKRAYLDWTYWGKPVPSFGSQDAQVMIVGLAPGAHGSNRTGRMFTGDASGDFLFPALHRAGFASRPMAAGRDDGMQLHNLLITAAARCAPPANKPTPQELRNCFPYLVEEFEALKDLRAIVAFGAIAFKATFDLLADRRYEIAPLRPKFGHGTEVRAAKGAHSITVISSFHPSRQNTNTGKLTQAMFDAIFSRTNELLTGP